MYEVDPARSEVADLRGVGELYLRRQCSIVVVRIRFDRAATRLRLPAPATSEALLDFVRQIDEIAAGADAAQFGRVARLLDAFELWSRGPLVRPEPPPEPVVVRPQGPQAQVVPEPPGPQVEVAPDPRPQVAPDPPTPREPAAPEAASHLPKPVPGSPSPEPVVLAGDVDLPHPLPEELDQDQDDDLDAPPPPPEG